MRVRVRVRDRVRVRARVRGKVRIRVRARARVGRRVRIFDEWGTGDSSLRIMASELKVDARRRWSFTSLFEVVAPALLPKSCAKAGCGMKSDGGCRLRDVWQVRTLW